MINLSQETVALARRLADAQHLSIDDVVRQALEARARDAGIAHPGRQTRDRSPEAVAARRARIDRVTRDIAALPVLDRRSAREIMDDINAV